MITTDRENLDKETADALKRGLEQSANGQTVSRGSFAQYADDEPNRWESAGKLTAPEGFRRSEYRDVL